jgi:hypothetical protein
MGLLCLKNWIIEARNEDDTDQHQAGCQPECQGGLDDLGGVLLADGTDADQEEAQGKSRDEQDPEKGRDPWCQSS